MITIISDLQARAVEVAEAIIIIIISMMIDVITYTIL